MGEYKYKESEIIKDKIKIAIMAIVFLSIIFFSYYIYNGIHIDKISLKTMSLKNVFIKFDGQITLEIEKFKVVTTSDDTNRRPKKLYRYLLLNLHLFKKFKIENLTYNKDTFSILYNKTMLLLTYKNLKIKANVIESNDEHIKLSARLDLENNISINIKSIITIHHRVDQVDLLGTANVLSKNTITKIPIKAKIKKESASFSLDAKTIKSINFINYFYKFKNKNINKWLFDKIKCKSYILENVSFEFDKNFNFLEDRLNLNLYCKNASIKYKKDLPPVLTQMMNIVIEDKDLKLNFLRPSMKSIKLYKSQVFIYDIFEKQKLLITLKSDNARLDKEFKNILKSYDIDVPIRQLNSYNKIEMNITQQLSTDSTTDIKASIALNNTTLMIKNEKFHIQKALVVIDNSDINISDINISNDIFEATNKSNIHIDTTKQTLEADINIHKLSLYSKKNNTDTLSSNIFIDFNKSIIALDDMKVTIDLSKKITKIIAKDLSKLKLKSIFGGTFSGDAKMYLHDRFYDIYIGIREHQTPFVYKKSSLKNFDIHVKYDTKMKMAILDGKNKLHNKINATINKHKTYIKLEGIDVNISNIQDQKSTQASKYLVSIEADNTKLFIKDNIVEFKKLKATIKNNKEIKITESSLSAKNINKAIKRDIFDKGSFEIKLQNSHTAHKELFYGDVIFKNTYIKDTNTFSNIFSFINLSPMGLGLSGLKVDNGKMSFVLDRDKLLLNPISLYSDSTNITGRGLVDIKTKEVDLYIKLSILKVLSSVAKQLPVLNKVIMGDKNDININMIAKGNFDNIDITLDSKQDIITQPFEIILRILLLPSTLIQDLIAQ